MSKRDPIANARFWIGHRGSFVKLTIAPYESVTSSASHPTEEGYHAHSETYTHCGDYVEMDFYSHSRDCDGRMESSYIAECPLDNLMSGEMYPETDSDVPGVPDWTPKHRSQRDYTAEAAGY